MNIKIHCARVPLSVSFAALTCSATACSNKTEAQEVESPGSVSLQEPYSYQMPPDMEQERKNYIAGRHRALDDMQSRIQRLRRRLQREGDLLSAQERADRDRQLFELEQKRRDLEARLEQAKTATPAEWQVIRNNIDTRIDRFDARVKTADNSLERLFAERESERQPVRGTYDAGTGIAAPRGGEPSIDTNAR